MFRTPISLCVASVLALVALLNWHFDDKRDAVDSAQQQALEAAKLASRQIDNNLSRLLIAQAIADDLTSGRLLDDDVEARLKSELERNPEVTTFGVCYKPEFVPPDSPNARLGRHCPYAVKDGDGAVTISRIENTYDPTLPDGTTGSDNNPISTAWYHRPINEGPVWNDPYFEYAAKRYYAGFGVPFFRTDPGTGGAVTAGVVNASVSLDQFQEQLTNPGSANSGSSYGFIVSANGEFVSYPVDSFVEDQKTLSDIGESLDAGNLLVILRTAEEGVLRVDHLDEQSGQDSWIFFAPISSTGWLIGFVLDKDEILRRSQITGRLRWQLVGAALAAIAALTFWPFRYIGGTREAPAVYGRYQLHFRCCCLPV